MWLRGYATRFGVGINLTTELWAWVVRTGLWIALVQSFRDIRKKKIGRL